MAVLAKIGIMYGKSPQIASVFRHKVADCHFPFPSAVIVFHIPSIAGNAVQRYFRRFGMLHRIGHERAHPVFYIRTVAIYLAHQQMVLHIVGNREIPPYISLALYQRIDEIEGGTVDISHHLVACPHHLYSGIKHVAERREIAAFQFCPRLVVFGRAYYQRSHVALHLHEIVVKIVEKLSLLVSSCPLARNIVEKHRESAHAQVVHAFKFPHKQTAVFIIPLYILPGMYGPIEHHAVSRSPFRKFT